MEPRSPLDTLSVSKRMNQSRSKFMALPLWLYAAGWIFYVYLFILILNFSVEKSNNVIVSGMYFINFGVHEATHLVLLFLPPIFVAAAGSIGEIGFTALMVIAALKAKAYFATVFTGLWMMLAFISAGRYMADARAQQLPLMGPGETVQHDWNYVFTQLGWLNADTIIGGTVQAIGIIIGIGSLFFGIYLVVLKRYRSA